MAAALKAKPAPVRDVRQRALVAELQARIVELEAALALQPPARKTRVRKTTEQPTAPAAPEQPTTYRVTLADNADPDLVGKYQAGMAKLKPSCCSCGKALPAKIAATCSTASTRVCPDREACRVRSIFRRPARV